MESMRWIKTEADSALQSLLYGAVEVEGPRVSMHHMQENTRQLLDCPGPRSLGLSLLTVYKKDITSLEPLSKSFRSHCKAPHFLLALKREM